MTSSLDEEHVGSRLWHFLYNILRKWIELNVLRHNITDRFWSDVLLLRVRVLENDVSNDVLLFRRQREARRRSDGRRGIVCLDSFAGRPQGDQHCNRCNNNQKSWALLRKCHVAALKSGEIRRSGKCENL